MNYAKYWLSVTKCFKMLRSRKRFVLFTLILISFSFLLQAAALPTTKSSKPNKAPAVYRRYVRKRPPVYADDEFMEEVVEEFYVKHRPPKFAMSDEDIELIIKCDRNPEYKECDKLKSKDQNPANASPTTVKPSSTPTPLEEFPLLPDIPKNESTEVVEDYDDYPWLPESTTKADQNFTEGNEQESEDKQLTDESSTTVQPNSTPLEEFPLLPDISANEDDDAEGDGNSDTDSTTDYPWLTETASTTEADPNFSEGSGDELEDDYDGDYW